jgi:protocatechuate 3,4-dioxygenase alpha subunit
VTGLELTASQTVGPFFSDALLRDPQNVLVQAQTGGERIRIEGQVYDGDRKVVEDALVEIWQANEHGRYNHPADRQPLPLDPAFSGFGRSGTDADGCFWFETIRPGRVPFDAERQQAPHILVTVASRGMLNHAVTRLYFEGEAANEADPVLSLVPEARRETLLARRTVVDGKPVYRFDIVLQGQGETVFFNV